MGNGMKKNGIKKNEMKKNGMKGLLSVLTDSLGRTATYDDIETSYLQLPDETCTCKITIPALSNLEIIGKPCKNKGLAKCSALQKASRACSTSMERTLGR